MKATTELKNEHRGIELMLRILEAVSHRADNQESLDQNDLTGIVEFLTIFVDKCHHGKEEDLLFPALESAGIAREGGPIGVLLAEHAEGRNIIRRLKAGIDEDKAKHRHASAQIASAARDYIQLLSQHIRKEDDILFPMADQRLSEEKDAELFEAFEKLEQERIGPGKHEQFHAMLDDLEKRYLTS
jgi:hemerythrin-like domain-containing protein